MFKPTKLNRFKGSLIGLAIGDALGTTLEFQRPGQFEPINDMIGGGPFNLEVGKWTDDTSMALCLAQSLIECKSLSPYDNMDKYLNWFENGYMSSVKNTCVDIGIATQKALIRYKDDYQPFCGSTDEFDSGNGSIMRICPIPLFFHNSTTKELLLKAEVSSKTTHASEHCISASRFFSYIIKLALEGKSKDEILLNYSNPLFSNETNEIKEVISGSYKRKHPPEIIGTGYVVKSLEASLWAFYNSNSFKEGALMAVNLGNDADTTGAIYGQIAGAYYGYKSIPVEWRKKLYMEKEIKDMATKIFKLSNQR